MDRASVFGTECWGFESLPGHQHHTALHHAPELTLAEGWIEPLVVFTHAEWLRASECAVKVFDGRRALLSYLKAQTNPLLAPAHINQLCDLIVRSPVPVIAPKPVAQPKPSIQPTPTPPAAARLTPVASTPQITDTLSTHALGDVANPARAHDMFGPELDILELCELRPDNLNRRLNTH